MFLMKRNWFTMGFLETLQRFEVLHLKTSECFSKSYTAKWERERACIKEGVLEEDSGDSVLVLALPATKACFCRPVTSPPQASGVLAPKMKELDYKHYKALSHAP